VSQSTLSIANGTGAAVRAALNTALQAQASNQSGSSAPSTTYAYQFWADTTTGILKIRNSSNNAWVELLQLDGTITIEDGSAAAPGLALRTDLDCGLYKVGTNSIGISTAGTARLTISSTGVVTIPGDLTVQGTTTTIDSTTLSVKDKNIEMGVVSSPSDTTADGGGLTLKGATDKTFNWVDSTDAWTSSEHIHLGDSKKLLLGASSDLSLYHDGSNSYIKNTTGSLYIHSDGLYLQNAANSESIAAFNNDGAVRLYYDGSEKLEIYNSGALISGNCKATGDFRIENDTGKIELGTSADLQLYHDGNHSYIKDNGTGALKLKGDDIRLEDSAGNNIIKSTATAAELYYDGTKHFETSSTGVTVSSSGSAELTVKGADNSDAILNIFCDNADNDGDHWRLINQQANNQLVWQHKGSGSYADKWVIDSSGNVALGGALDLTDNNKILLGDGDDLQIYHTGSHSYIDSNTGTLYIRHSGEYGAAFIKDSGVDLYFDNNRQFATYSEGIYSKTHIPFVDDTYHLGGSSYRWDNIWATSGTVNTSDRNTKNTIVTSDLGLPFINKLKPVSYKFNGKTRTHYGLIAQDIETTLSDISKSTTDFAGFVKDKGKDGEDVYALRYTEFIAPLIKAIQELSAENESLKARLTALEAE
jgi:hypothetical protein